MGFINHSCLIIHLVPRIQPTHPVETCPSRSASQGSSPEYLEELDRGESNPHAAKIATSNDSLLGGWGLAWKIMGTSWDDFPWPQYDGKVIIHSCSKPPTRCGIYSNSHHPQVWGLWFIGAWMNWDDESPDAPFDGWLMRWLKIAGLPHRWRLTKKFKDTPDIHVLIHHMIHLWNRDSVVHVVIQQLGNLSGRFFVWVFLIQNMGHLPKSHGCPHHSSYEKTAFFWIFFGCIPMFGQTHSPTRYRFFQSHTDSRKWQGYLRLSLHFCLKYPERKDNRWI